MSETTIGLSCIGFGPFPPATLASATCVFPLPPKRAGLLSPIRPREPDLSLARNRRRLPLGGNVSKRAETRNCPAFQRLRTHSSGKNTTESERGRFPRPSQFDRSSSGLMRTESLGLGVARQPLRKRATQD